MPWNEADRLTNRCSDDCMQCFLTDVDGAPLRVRMTHEFRAFFRAGPPPGYVRAKVSGRREACHVTRGKRRWLYVRIPDMPPLLPEASHDAHS